MVSAKALVERQRSKQVSINYTMHIVVVDDYVDDGVVAVLTTTRRQNRVRGHSTGSKNCWVEAHLRKKYQQAPGICYIRVTKGTY